MREIYANMSAYMVSHLFESRFVACTHFKLVTYLELSKAQNPVASEINLHLFALAPRLVPQLKKDMYVSYARTTLNFEIDGHTSSFKEFLLAAPTPAQVRKLCPCVVPLTKQENH